MILRREGWRIEDRKMRPLIRTSLRHAGRRQPWERVAASKGAGSAAAGMGRAAVPALPLGAGGTQPARTEA